MIPVGWRFLPTWVPLEVLSPPCPPAGGESHSLRSLCVIFRDRETKRRSARAIRLPRLSKLCAKQTAVMCLEAGTNKKVFATAFLMLRP